MNRIEERAKKYTPILQRNWQRLASVAWEIYQEKGYCVIHLKESDLDADHWEEFRISYDRPGYPPVPRYNPLTEIMVALISDDSKERDIPLKLSAQGTQAPPPEC